LVSLVARFASTFQAGDDRNDVDGRSVRVTDERDAEAEERLHDVLSSDALAAAPLLLGAIVSRVGDDGERVAVRITEVEAYLGERDPGSHAFRGRTPRTAVMFGLGGHVYAYFSYGMHICLNVVCGVDGVASACLLRAGEVVEGADAARRRRLATRRARPGAPLRDRDLARGPANLAAALGVSLADSGLPIDRPPYSLELPDAPVDAASIVRGLRVGLSAPGGLDPFHWRFWIDGDPTVSAYTPHRTVREAGRRN